MEAYVYYWKMDIDMAMNEQELKEYHARKNREFYLAHKDDPDRKARNYEAVKKYQSKLREQDEEAFMENRRRISAASEKRRYKAKRAAMTEEQLEKRKAQMREYARRRREQIKAAARALEEKNKQDGN